jgi:hypothetical protein
MILGAVTLGVSYGLAGSLDPIEGFRSLAGGRFVVLLAASALFGLSVLIFLSYVLLVRKIERDTGKSIWDVRCRFCSQSVGELAPRSGPAMQCPHCDEWVHVMHWTANGGSPLKPCPGCELTPDGDRTPLEKLLRQYRAQ